MVGLKIKMPSSCSRCPYETGSGEEHWCKLSEGAMDPLDGMSTNEYERKRHPECKLIDTGDYEKGLALEIVSRLIGIPSIGLKSFYDLTKEEREELNAQYEERNGEKLTEEELEETYKDTSFIGSFLQADARERKRKEDN